MRSESHINDDRGQTGRMGSGDGSKIGYDRMEMECFAKVLVDGMG